MLCVLCFMKQYFLRLLKIRKMQKLLARCGRLFWNFHRVILKKNEMFFNSRFLCLRDTWTPLLPITRLEFHVALSGYGGACSSSTTLRPFMTFFYDSISKLSSPFNINIQNKTEVDGWPYLHFTTQVQKARGRKISNIRSFYSIFTVLMHTF